MSPHGNLSPSRAEEVERRALMFLSAVALNLRGHYWRVRFILFVGVLAGFLASMSSVGATVIYQTSFEASEGYNTNLDLVGQQGWVGAGSGGNGVASGFFPGKGQQAYIGFTPPLTNDTSLFVYHPITNNPSQVQFSVTMAIVDSTTTNRDDFYWSVFNKQGDQLFTLDFDNFELKVYYYLDTTNGNRTFSELFFTNAVAYQLSMALNFTSNLWSATFNGAILASNKPITTVGSPLNMGDIDAAWVVFDPAAPGDNFMVFDDYTISATVPQPQLRFLGASNGLPALRLTGLATNRFAVEASTNLLNWSALTTNLVTSGSFDFVDTSAAGLPRRFYRGRWVP